MGCFFPTDSKRSNASTTIYATPTQRNGTVKHRNKDSGFQEDTTTKKRKKKRETKTKNKGTNAKEVSPRHYYLMFSKKSKETLVRKTDLTDNGNGSRASGLNYSIFQHGEGL